jgi:hypothetical protein
MTEKEKKSERKKRDPVTLMNKDGVAIDVRDLDPYLVKRDKVVRRVVNKAYLRLSGSSQR